MRTIVLICAILFGLALLLRYSIFGFGYGPIVTGDHYDRPVALHRMALPAKRLPLGCEVESQERAGYRIITAAEEKANELLRFELPSTGVSNLLVADYRYQDEHFVLVALQYQSNGEAKAVRRAFVAQDNVALVLVGPETGPARRALEQAFLDHLREEKILRRKVEKMKTAGNATLCFVMDLLVGAFFFVLCLFLAKYFLIVKNVEH